MNTLKFTNFAIRKDRRIALLLREDSTKRNEQPLKHSKFGSQLVWVVAVAAVCWGLNRSVRADLFVSDLGGSEVRKFTDTGTSIPPVPFIGAGGGEGFACATVGSQGEIFLANNGSQIGLYDTANGTQLQIFANSSSGLVSVAALSLSPDGTLLYAADYGSSHIYAFDTLDPNPGKQPIYTVNTPASHDVRVGPDGSVYAANFQQNTGVLKFNSTLSALPVQFVPPNNNGLDSPAGMTFDRSGNLWVSNFHNSTVTSQVNEYAPSGTFIRTVNNSTPGNTLTQPLKGPFGIDVGPDGNIYVTSFFTNSVEKINVVTGTMSDFILNSAGSQPKYLAFTEDCVRVAEMFPAEQCCGEKPHFGDSAYTSVFTGQVAVATNWGPNSPDVVLGVVDLKNQSSAPLNTNYAPPIYHGPASAQWTKALLGDIFGVTLDEFGNIYVTATTAYPFASFCPGTCGKIYKISGTTGAITTFQTLPNAGAGLGNIKYDCVHRNFYVSNIDDGLIYRLDLNGNILSTWDHGLNLPMASPPSPAITGDIPGSVYTKLGRRVWGLQAAHGRLYYAVWWEDQGRPDANQANEVWSIALSPTGNFVPGTDKLEITIPVVALNYSNPVADISFGPAGTMLLTERTISGDNHAFAAHQSRAQEYTLSAGTWTLLNPTKFQISSIYPPGSASGGSDYDFSAGGRVWVTGDALHLGGNDNIYGLQGLPGSGGSIVNSILIDLNGVVSMQDKTEIGDVEIPCPDCEIDGTVITPSTVGGSYTYQFTITNHSNQPASNIVILPVSGVTSITPQTFHISPPLAPGQTSQQFTVTLGGAQPGGQACFNIALVSTNGSTCCSRQVCVPIPGCFEVLEQRVQALPNNMVRVTVTLRSLVDYTLSYAAFLPANGRTATPDFIKLDPTVPPLGIVTVSTVISPVAAGETVFYTLTIHEDELKICCSRDLSFTASGTSAPGGTPTPSIPPGGTPTPRPGPSAGPLNLSTRLRVQTGDNVGIGGLIITGGAPKHVLARAIGPSLTQVGVPDALADTVLELHGPGAFATITNDNWRDDPVQEAAILATGLAPTNNLESAIDTTMNPGAYTAVVRGKNNTSGVALIEVYDLSPAVQAKLANISTRAFVGTADNVVIAGFVLGGQDNDRIALRGIGPSLIAVGVTNALPDPTLELRDGNGALLMANNDWQDDPAQAAELTAAGLAPTNQLESGIAATLPPGTYTALLAGHNNGTGVGLVEFYDLNAAGEP